ncbi:MAG: penicillin acylase family protein, partial [Deltaproteobacteria bacterium]|nr:penicillin acylase family protein [Deltaproteobacteria bacterium]
MANFETPIVPRVLSALLRPYLRRLARSSRPRYSGELTLPGLKKQVNVYWQNEGIPHVIAASEPDLFLAQGYLHAQERLWQMDLARRFLSGRMAEILGRFPVPWRELTSQFRGHDTVDADYFMRLVGIRRSALASLEFLHDDDRQRLEAYCCGVNRFIEQCGKHLPLEFRLLRYQPDPWRAEDTLTIGKGFAFLLALPLFTRLNAMAVAARLSDAPELLYELYPTYSDDEFTITRGLWDSTEKLWQFGAGMLGGCDWYPAAHGSNAWVIGPSRSSQNCAILCNDPHLRMTLPPVWYLMELGAEAASIQGHRYEVWGVTVPGLPGVQVGHNRWIAWGITAALCDDVDIYREKIDPSEPDRYEVDGRWQLMERYSETIQVRRKAPVEKIVRCTRHGPVISDFDGRTSTQEALSLRWTAHEPGQDLRAVFGLNRARNWDEFLQALSHQSTPTLNVIYADRKGNIGYSLAGKVPLRTGAPSVLPREGWRGDHEW